VGRREFWNHCQETPVPTINVPANSQFYNKTVVHENRHVQQYVSAVVLRFIPDFEFNDRAFAINRFHRSRGER
jgi:hypothetical protein